MYQVPFLKESTNGRKGLPSDLILNRLINKYSKNLAISIITEKANL